MPTQLVTRLSIFEQALIRCRFKPSTITAYKAAFRAFLEHIAPRELEELTSEEISAYLHDLYGRLPKVPTQRLHHRALYLYYTEVAPEVHVDLPAPASESTERELYILPHTAVMDMLSQTTNLKHKALMALAYDRGLKLGELLDLKRQDVDLVKHRLTIGTGKKGRTLKIPNGLAQLLSDYDAEQPPRRTYYFEGQNEGTPLSNRGAQELIKQAARRTGLPTERLAFQALRHSCAVRCLEQHIDPKYIQHLLGLESRNMLRQYAHYARASGEDRGILG